MYRFTAIIFLILIMTNCNQLPKQDEVLNSKEDTVDVQVRPQIPLEDFDVLIQELEAPERMSWQNPDMVISKMGNFRGQVIVDIGPGTGYFALRIVKSGGFVIANDIEQKFIDYIEERKSELSSDASKRLTTRLIEPDDPGLLTNEADWVLIVNTYYFLDDRVKYLGKVKKGLKQNGKILIVDYKIGDMPVGPGDTIKIPVANAIKEIKSAGFTILEIDNSSLQYQYIIVAQK